jgi:hypothetical protein
MLSFCESYRGDSAPRARVVCRREMKFLSLIETPRVSMSVRDIGMPLLSKLRLLRDCLTYMDWILCMTCSSPSGLPRGSPDLLSGLGVGALRNLVCIASETLHYNFEVGWC